MIAYQVSRHEARHAVAAWLFNFPVTRMTLSFRGDSGKCYWEAPEDADIHAVMQVCLAGACGDGPEFRSSSDVRVASSKYAQWCRTIGPQPPFESKVAQWLIDCRVLLMDSEPRIRRVANALLAKRQLDQRDLADLLPPPRHDHPVVPRRKPPVVAPASTVRRVIPEKDAICPDVQEARYWLMAENYRRRQGRQW